MDSGWIDKIVDVSAWVWVVIASSTGLVWLGVLDTGDGWPGWMEPTLASICLLSSFAALCRAGAWLRKRIQKWNRKRLKRRFAALSEDQREFIKTIYRTGQRDFQVRTHRSSERWLEELRLWNYVARPSKFFYVGETVTFYLTEAAWQMLDRELRSSSQCDSPT